ncbi:MAG: hypothetical protein RJA07_944 [Bacteroidota bacterium]|jgi:hypothetical protein
MKRITTLLSFIAISFTTLKGQNLILNPSFEKHWGGDCTFGSSYAFYDTFNVTTPFGCTIKDWIRISESPDGFCYNGVDFPQNWLSRYLYPHSDSVCVGAEFIGKTATNLREIIQGN